MVSPRIPTDNEKPTARELVQLAVQLSRHSSELLQLALLVQKSRQRIKTS